MNIKLTRNKYAIIDDNDFPLVESYSWNCLKIGYASTSIGGRKNKKMIYMHRLIINAKKDEHVDHINGNKLDNRRENLRIVNRFQNLQNSKKHSNAKTSNFKGVYLRKDGRKKKWAVTIRINGINKIIGSFYTELEAAKAYNEASKKYHGVYGKQNNI